MFSYSALKEEVTQLKAKVTQLEGTNKALCEVNENLAKDLRHLKRTHVSAEDLARYHRELDDTVKEARLDDRKRYQEEKAALVKKLLKLHEEYGELSKLLLINKD